MSTYTVQGPSGKSYTIDGPDGATADQLGQVILSQNQGERAAAEYQREKVQYNPTNDMSTTDRVVAGIGRGMTSVGRGIGGLIGLQSAQDTADAKQTDAPLMATTSGKTGSAIGQAAAVFPAMLAAPAAATTAGTIGIAAGVGGLTGALTTEGGLKDRAEGALAGAAGGALGAGAGKLLGAGANLVKSKLAANALAAAPRDAAVTAAQDAGYVLPPNQINPDLKNGLMQAWSGPVKTTQAAAAANQGTTNKLAARAVGLPEDAPITVDALNGVRKTAGQAYDAVAQSGTIKPTPAYDAALDKITAPFKQAAAGFPNAKPNPIIDTIDSLKSPEFDATSAVSKIGELRDAADVAYRGGDKAAGKAYKDGAAAIEDAIDQHLQATGAPADLLNGFRDARQTIAKTYDVQKALKGENVNAQTLATIQQKYPGRLSNELDTIATTGTNFPKATALLKEEPSSYSAVDGFGSLSAMAGAIASHNPLAMLPAAAIAARPLVRSAILSPAGQSFAAMRPGATIQNALSGAAQSRLARGTAMVGSMAVPNLLVAPSK